MNLAQKRNLVPGLLPDVHEKEQVIADAELVALAKNGDKHAFAQLVTRHQIALRAIAYHATGNWDTVEDLSQEAMFCAWTHISELKDAKKFRPWLATIVRNTARNLRRHQLRHAPSADHTVDSLEKLPSQAPTPLQEIQDREAVSIARQGIARLSGRYREVLLLFFSLGESHAEVANALGLSEVNTRQRLTRARKKLRGEIADIRRYGSRIAATSSSTAAILLCLGTREAWATVPVSHAAGYSAKLLVSLGALGGAALVACIVAIVSLVNSGYSDRRPSSNETGMRADVVESPVGNHSPPIENLPYAESTPADSVVPRGTVRIGSGKARNPKANLPSSMSTKIRALEHKQRSLEEKQERNRPARTSRGGLKKHGPAVLRRDQKTEARVLLKPSIDIRDVRRDLWN